MVNSINSLPPELLEQVFLHLSGKDLLSVSAVCKKFNEIVNNCENLTKKLKIKVVYPGTDWNSLRKSLTNTQRRYRNLTIVRSRKRANERDIEQLSNVFAAISPTVKNLQINWQSHRSIEISLMDIASRPRREMLLHHLNNRAHMNANHINNNNNNNNFVQLNPAHFPREDIKDELHKEFVSIMKQFWVVKKLSLNNVILEKHTHAPDTNALYFGTLQELNIKYCDAYCFDVLSTVTQLEKFEISDPYWSAQAAGISMFESFLVRQTALKDLKIKAVQYPRLFQVDITRNIRFKLNHLVLDNVCFKDKIIAENFFRTQNELKTIKFQVQNDKLRNLDEMLWYNNILKIVFSQNLMLTEVTLEKLKYKLDDCDFLNNVRNNSVRKLNFNVTGENENSIFFKKLIQIFPNLTSIDYKSDESEHTDGDISFDKGTVLDKVKNLTIINSSVHSLINIYAENLETFEYSPKLNGHFIDDYIGGFLHRHRTIKHLVIGNKYERSYFFASYNLCQLIVNFLNQLESATIYNFAEVNKSVKLLCTLRNLKSLTLSSVQYQQFTAKTKVECERMKLKLIPDEMNIPFEANDYVDNSLMVV